MSRWGAAVFVFFAASAFAQEPAPTYVLHFGRTGPSPGMMLSPFGVCTDDAGFVYVAELGGDRVQKWTTTGDYVTRWGGAGASPGLLEQPTDVALDALGNVWVSDRANHRLQCFSREGTFLAAFGGPGSAPGEFLSPSGLTVDASHLFVADTYNYTIQKLAIHGTTLAPVLSFGSFGPEPGQFSELQDVGIDSEGRIHTTDARNNCVQIFAPDGRFLETEIGSSPGELRRASRPSACTARCACGSMQGVCSSSPTTTTHSTPTGSSSGARATRRRRCTGSPGGTSSGPSDSGRSPQAVGRTQKSGCPNCTSAESSTKILAISTCSGYPGPP